MGIKLESQTSILHLDIYKGGHMKKNKYMITIGAIIWSLFFLSREPFLARTMSNEEKLITAIEHTINSSSYTYHGKIATLSNVETLNQIPIDEDLFVYIEGGKYNTIKNLKIALSSARGLEDISLGNYYEDKDYIYLITPFKSCEKMIFNKNKTNNWDFNMFIEILKPLQISREKNKVITINQDTYDEVNIITDCYIADVDIIKTIKTRNLINEKWNAVDNLEKLRNLKVKIYIDEAYYIRKIEGIFELDNEYLFIEVYVNNFSKERKIEIPNKTDAHIINEPLEKWILNKLQ